LGGSPAGPAFCFVALIFVSRMPFIVGRDLRIPPDCMPTLGAAAISPRENVR
jgi:hypothetical protein